MALTVGEPPRRAAVRVDEMELREPVAFGQKHDLPSVQRSTPATGF